ncbi:unnamed protein product [Linum tenue]|uniref:Uncharacterized protein n=1 Tax=Linum tenue TaxID=586396 RepID=A0AAV0REQ3_9ROSI|nr:unnamed protein product [Linum tenue]
MFLWKQIAPWQLPSWRRRTTSRRKLEWFAETFGGCWEACERPAGNMFGEVATQLLTSWHTRNPGMIPDQSGLTDPLSF